MTRYIEKWQHFVSSLYRAALAASMLWPRDCLNLHDIVALGLNHVINLLAVRVSELLDVVLKSLLGVLHRTGAHHMLVEVPKFSCKVC
jgi:hypothetical protein